MSASETPNRGNSLLLAHKGPIGDTQGGQGAYPKIPEIGEIPLKQFSGGVWGETGSPKGLLDTIQSIWVTANPPIFLFETICSQNQVFPTPIVPPKTSTG